MGPLFGCTLFWCWFTNIKLDRMFTPLTTDLVQFVHELLSVIALFFFIATWFNIYWLFQHILMFIQWDYHYNS